MNGVEDKVAVAKNALMNSLGDNFYKYLENMKMWFRHNWTKDEFDRESRKLLTVDQMQLHNKFFMAILNKMEVFKLKDKHSGSNSQNPSGSGHGSRSRKRKRGSRSAHERVPFEPYDFLDFIAEDNMAFIRAAPTSHGKEEIQIMPTQRYCVQEMFLPDAGFLLGRFLIGAWEIGLNTVDEPVAEYMMVAIQVLLKNLVTAIIMKRKHYKVTGDGTYYYDIGAPLKDPSERNTVTRLKIDDAPLELDKEITSPNFVRRSNEDGVFLSVCEEPQPTKKTLITLKDAQLAMNNRNLILSHVVYSVNAERLTQMLH